MSSVSILMPVKNAAMFLTQTLESIRSQDFQDWELIAVNDHSSDESFDLLQSFSKSDSRIQVFQNEGQGIIHALRLAYSKSSSNLITRMDSDDLMPEHKLSRMVSHTRPAAVVTGKVSYFREDQELGDGYRRYADWLNALVDNQNHWKNIYKECVIPSPCWMMHREDLDRIGAFQSDVYPEDYDLVFRMYAASLKVICVPEELHLWRDHPERSSRTDEHYVDNRFLDLKISYFISLDFHKETRLLLWGAGKKGKYIARHLHQEGIAFTWITNNSKKWGKEIHGVILQEAADLLPTDQVIIAVAAPEEQEEIKKELQNSGVKAQYFFC
jgi:glycosyltransferase involved in cell wall biosynthesis